MPKFQRSSLLYDSYLIINNILYISPDYRRREMELVDVALAVRRNRIGALAAVVQDVGKINASGEVILVAEPQSESHAIQAGRFQFPRQRLIAIGHTGIVERDEA